MDLYSSERWTLDRHQEMIRSAERRASLRPEPPAVRAWMASSLRSLADRIDGPPAKRRAFKVVPPAQ
jgi:hypothetical protein